MGDYTIAIRLDHNDKSSYNGRGLAYYQTGQYRLAIADFNRAIQLDPGYAFAFSCRGLAYDQLQEIDRARLDIQMACSLDSQFWSSLKIAAPTAIPVPAATSIYTTNPSWT
ncbi:MAG TPA: tetratricopeptide repeat protein [Dehalococcoidia bacterium]|nr:tetratricopeptide repeat protein [Dehalococcoidia bacterium]